MNSPTHILLALAVLSKKQAPLRNRAVFIGALIPDAFIYVGWVWLTFVKHEPQARIWDEIYFDTPMQITASIFNSIPLYVTLACISYWALKSKVKYLTSYINGLYFFALAALIHIATDAPVHNHDAYAHFWPVSDWRFISPFSYYERDHHAATISLIELCIVLGSILILSQRFPKLWVKATLGFFASLYIVLQILYRLAPPGSAG